MRAVLIWGVLLGVAFVALGVAAASPYLEWRDPVYIVAGFAGVVALVLLLFQPLLVAGVLPGIARAKGRRVHLWTGAALVLAVLAVLAVVDLVAVEPEVVGNNFI